MTIGYVLGKGNYSAPVVRFATLRGVIAPAVQQGWRVECMDVVVDFLYGELGSNGKIFLRLPSGFGETIYLCKQMLNRMFAPCCVYSDVFKMLHTAVSILI